jgi:hypothetical protein
VPETEIHEIKADSKIKRKTNLVRRGADVCHRNKGLGPQITNPQLTNLQITKKIGSANPQSATLAEGPQI